MVESAPAFTEPDRAGHQGHLTERGLGANQPAPEGPDLARNTTATGRGSVSVNWKLAGQTLNVTHTAPTGVKVKHVKNETDKGLNVVV